MAWAKIFRPRCLPFRRSFRRQGEVDPTCHSFLSTDQRLQPETTSYREIEMLSCGYIYGELHRN